MEKNTNTYVMSSALDQLAELVARMAIASQNTNAEMGARVDTLTTTLTTFIESQAAQVPRTPYKSVNSFKWSERPEKSNA